MFLEYLALVILVLVLIMFFFAIIYLHDLPYEAAKRRNHPHLDVIHVACWLSMFTLHALWPLIYIWALLVPRALSVRIVDEKLPSQTNTESDLRLRLADLEERLKKIETGKA